MGHHFQRSFHRGGDLTANMKLKREIITTRYLKVIDALYQGPIDPHVLHFGQLEAIHEP